MDLKYDTDVIYYVKKLRKAVNEHESWRAKKTLNLIPSENFASPSTRSFLSGDLSNRYTAPDHFYRGTRFSDNVQDLANEVARKLYRCKFASVKPLSGHTCSMIAFMSLLKPGDRLVTCPPKYGGYPGSSEEGLGPLLHLKNLYFPYDPEKMNIVSQETRKLLASKKPEMTVFGSSHIPFPYRIKESVPEEYAGYNIYDGSHVMGLIAGDKFQDPLREGSSILMGSTHKTLFGPQGGIMLSNDHEVFSKIEEKIFPGIVDNIHLNRVASLTFAMLELLKFGRSYATQVICNSKELARDLDDLDIRVKCKQVGFTESHQVLLGYDDFKSVKIANLLEKIDVITDIGIRLGTAEVTRRGMKEGEMEAIAHIISDAIRGNTSKENLKSKVHHLVKEFDLLEYSLK
jgi:glycine hydroxymethyltransferase